MGTVLATSSDDNAVIEVAHEPSLTLVTTQREPQRPSSRPKRQSRGLTWDKKRTAELFRRYHATDDQSAREELVTMYLNLVKYLAGKYRFRGECIDDLVQVGTIGLIKAVDRFDLERGLEFTTYATPTIVGEIKRHFRDKTWTIKLPRRLQELTLQINRAVDHLTQTLQHSPTIGEIAAYLGVTDEDVLEAMEAGSAYFTVPIEGAHVGPEGDTCNLIDVIGVDDPLIAAVDDNATLASALDGVSVVERQLLYLRFHDSMTQSEIARTLGISQMQVSRMLRKTIALLRQRIVSKSDTPADVEPNAEERD